MFMVVNKDKIISYIVSVSTVAILFVMSYVITEDNEEVLQTSGNITQVTQNVNYENSNNTIENEYNRTGLN